METTAQAPVDEDIDYSAAFDKITEGQPITEETPVDETPDQPVAEETPEIEAAPEPEEAPPSDLPSALKSHWKTIPPDAREALVASQREMGRKAAEAGRLAQGLNPIRDVLVEASSRMPHLMNMRPEQVAAEVMQLAEIGQRLNDKPVETLLQVARDRGVLPQLAQVIAGQKVEPQNTAVLQNEIKSLKAQLARVSDPEYLREQVSTITVQERATEEVTRFAQSAEHWADVEPHLPNIIPIAKARLGDGASPSDVLKASYDMAIQIIKPDALAKAQAATMAAAADPKKAEAVLKAKSVNVSGQTSGKAREMTEDEIYQAAYERAMRK